MRRSKPSKPEPDAVSGMQVYREVCGRQWKQELHTAWRTGCYLTPTTSAQQAALQRYRNNQLPEFEHVTDALLDSWLTS